jgi:hypothetical protein
VTGKNIKNNAVTSKKIRNHTIRKKDVKKGLLTSIKISPLSSVAYEASRDSGPGPIGPSAQNTVVATLTGIPPGAYVVFAKADLNSTQLDRATCHLQAGSAVDDTRRGLRSNGTPEAINMQLAYTFPSTGTATLSCHTTDGSWTAADSKVLAVQVDSASVVASGG